MRRKAAEDKAEELASVTAILDDPEAAARKAKICGFRTVALTGWEPSPA